MRYYFIYRINKSFVTHSSGNDAHDYQLSCIAGRRVNGHNSHYIPYMKKRPIQFYSLILSAMNSFFS